MIEFRDVQLEAFRKIEEAIEAGKTDIFLEAPTGSGKSLIAMETAMRYFERKNWASYILTSNKALQKQYEDDIAQGYDGRFKPIKSIVGVDNYTCHLNGESYSLGVCKVACMPPNLVSALPCNKTCEYLCRRREAQKAPVSIMNYAYYLLQMNYVYTRLKDKAPFGRRHIVICDEAHNLNDIIENHFSPRISLGFVDILRRHNRDNKDRRLPWQKLDNILHYITILGDSNEHKRKQFSYLKLIYDEFSRLVEMCSHYRNDISREYDLQEDVENYKKLPPHILRSFRLFDRIKDIHCKFEDFYEIIQNTTIRDFVIDIQENEIVYHNLGDTAAFRTNFKGFSRVRIYMSATLQSTLMAERFGLDPAKTEIITLDPRWNPENSRVILTNTTSFSYQNTHEALRLSTKTIDGILANHLGERGVIHTTSYMNAQHLMDHCKQSRRFIAYSDTESKQEILSRIDELPSDAVIIGPSLSEGIDLCDNLGRFNIIMKVSYPNVASKLWENRYRYNREVYMGKAASILEQASGRTTRNVNDFSTTYILDSRATNFIQRSSHLFSESFLQRVTG